MPTSLSECVFTYGPAGPFARKNRSTASAYLSHETARYAVNVNRRTSIAAHES